MSGVERFFLWLFLVASIGAGIYFVAQLNQENGELRSALSRINANQSQLNANFLLFSQAAEQQLSRQAREIQGIGARIGTFKASLDTESGAVVWEK